MYKHILLATDGSPCALRAADGAAALAETYQSKVTVIYVQPYPEPMISAATIPLSEEFISLQESNYADEHACVIARVKPIFATHHVDFDCISARGFAGDTIPAVAAQVSADLIVIGHRGLNSLQSLFLGSTSERVVHTARCSVLVVR